jgi:hypothetical protein
VNLTADTTRVSLLCQTDIQCMVERHECVSIFLSVFVCYVGRGFACVDSPSVKNHQVRGL